MTTTRIATKDANGKVWLRNRLGNIVMVSGQFAVFDWVAGGEYDLENAVRLFTTEKAARKFVERGDKYRVVRPVDHVTR